MKIRFPKLTAYRVYIIVIAVLALLPILAPILLKLSESYQVFLWPARAVYFAYSFTCHQFHHRSLYLFDYQFAWCARDTGIWLGILSAAIYFKKSGMKPLPWYWFLPFIVPIALDGGIQTIATVLGIQNPYGITGDILYVSNNFTRFLTGMTFGVGLGLVISPFISENFPKFKPLNISYLKHLAYIFIPLLLIYVVLIQGWRLTSITNLPSDNLDSAVKTPAEDLFRRRQDGACPGTAEKLVDFEC